MKVGFYETKDGTNPLSGGGMHGQFAYDVDFERATGACSITVSKTTTMDDGTIEKTTTTYSGTLTNQ